MMEYDLTAKEREIAERLCDHPLLKGTSVPEGLLFWSAKLLALVNGNDPRVAGLYKVVRDCLYSQTSVNMFAQYAFVETADAMGPEEARTWERWQSAYMRNVSDARHSAYQAADIAASILGVPIDTNALALKGSVPAHSTEMILEAAYHALTSEIQAPGL